MSVCVCARYVPSRQRMRIPQRVAHVSFAVVVVAAVVCAGWRLRCLRCFAACANVNPLGLARAVADSLEKYMAMGFLCFVLFSYTHTDTHTYTPTLTGSKRARARERERKRAKPKFASSFFSLYTLGKFYARFVRSVCMCTRVRLCECVCLSPYMCVCVCEFVCGAVFGGLEPVASYCLTCALDLLSILFVIIVVVTVVVVLPSLSLSLALCVPVCVCCYLH